MIANFQHFLAALIRRGSWSIVIAVFLAAGCGEDAASTLRKAQDLEAKGELNEAITILTTAARSDPKDGAMRYRLGRLYTLMFDSAAAHHEFTKAGELGAVEGGRVALGLQQSLFEQGKYTEIVASGDPSASFEAGPLGSIHAVRGAAQLMLGNYGKAVEELDRARKVDPAGADPVLLEAMVAAIARNRTRAFELIDGVIARDSKHVGALIARAQLNAVLGRTEDALKAYEQALRLQPNHLVALGGRAMHLIETGRVADAQKDIDTLRRLYPRHEISTYLQGQIHYWRTEYREALDMAQRILKADQNDRRGRLLSAQANLALGSPDHAVNDLSHYLKQNPRHWTVRRLHGEVRAEIELRGPALSELAAILSLDIKRASVQVLWEGLHERVGHVSTLSQWLLDFAGTGSTELLQGMRLVAARHTADEFAIAIDELDAISALGTDFGPADTALVFAALAARDQSRAIAAAERLQAKRGARAYAAALKGWVQAEQGHRANSAQSMLAAIELDPKCGLAAVGLAQVEASEGKSAAARSRIEALLKADPDNLQGLMAMAQFDTSAGKRAAAIDAYERAIRQHPKALEPRLRLTGMLLSDKGNEERAIAVASDGFAAMPNSPIAVELLAEAKHRTGDVQGAVELYNKLTRMLPRSAAAYFKLGRAQFKAGRSAEADGSLTQAFLLHTDEPADRPQVVSYLIAEAAILKSLEDTRRKGMLVSNARRRLLDNAGFVDPGAGSIVSDVMNGSAGRGR